MMRSRWMSRFAVTIAFTALLSQVAVAQTKLRTGVLLFNQVRELAARDTTLSGGRLIDLQTDPNFTGGDFQMIVNDAANILSGRTVVNRGGYFPENQGIPRAQQLTVSEVVYQIYSLPNGTELFLYRSPRENTAEYFIRRKS